MKNINSLQKELALVKKLIKDEIIEEKTISDLYKYIFKSDGKKLRAKLSLITSSINKRKNKKRLKLAAIIELLHTATLVHDDVVDDAAERRGFLSINALWKNKIAVLVGDYLLSRGLLITTENNRIDLLRIVSKAVKSMSEGELLQMEKARNLDITEEVYFKIIEQKTASLVSACCGTGACSVGVDEGMVELMEEIGKYVGIAFQIKDDIFDYGFSDKIGKPTGIDLKERKLTLPLIHVLNKIDRSSRKMIINTIKKEKQDPQKIKNIIDLVIQQGGIEYAENQMYNYRDKALVLLKKVPDSPAKSSFELLIDYSIKRAK